MTQRISRFAFQVGRAALAKPSSLNPVGSAAIHGGRNKIPSPFYSDVRQGFPNKNTAFEKSARISEGYDREVYDSAVVDHDDFEAVLNSETRTVKELDDYTKKAMVTNLALHEIYDKLSEVSRQAAELSRKISTITKDLVDLGDKVGDLNVEFFKSHKVTADENPLPTKTKKPTNPLVVSRQDLMRDSAIVATGHGTLPETSMAPSSGSGIGGAGQGGGHSAGC